MSSTSCSDHLLGWSTTQTHLYTSALMFGANVSWLLLGILIMQTYTYYRRSKRRRLIFISFVYGVVVLQIFQTISDSYVAYTTDIQDRGGPYAGNEVSVVASSDLLPLSNVLTAFVVQYFFMWRIYSFSVVHYRGKLKTAMLMVCIFILLVGLLALSSGLAIAISVYALSQAPAWWDSIFFVWMTAIAATDLLITISMSCTLYHARSQVCFGETRNRIAKIIRLTIQTGLLTSGIALLFVALYARKTFLFIFPLFALGKFYAFSLLANLNARMHSSSEIQEGEDVPRSPQIHIISFTSRLRGNEIIFRSIGTSIFSRSVHINQPATSMTEETREVAEDSPPPLGSGKSKSNNAQV